MRHVSPMQQTSVRRSVRLWAPNVRTIIVVLCQSVAASDPHGVVFQAARAKARARPGAARRIAQRDLARTRQVAKAGTVRPVARAGRRKHGAPAPASSTGRRPMRRSRSSRRIQGLCGVLENAALLWRRRTGGRGARAAAEAGVHSDLETKQSPLAWLALFDLIQRACDREGFDKLAMEYVVQFERSAPAWEEPAAPKADINDSHGGFVALAGKLSAAGGAQWQGLRRAIETRVPQAQLDLSAITSYDDGGARLLAGLLADARTRARGARRSSARKSCRCCSASRSRKAGTVDRARGCWRSN